jgi:Ca2+-binding RTX toxin-like protein
VDFLLGDSAVLHGHARGGGDLLVGGSEDDRLYGDAGAIGLDGPFGEMFDASRGGNDRLDGGSESDTLIGDGDSMSDHAHGGDDRLFGDSGNDTLYGDATQAGAYDAPAADVRGGGDVLIGGTGDDRLWGDFVLVDGTAVGGGDRFVFARGSGHDTIFDFEDNKDKIDLSGYHGIDNFAEVRAHSTRSGADTVIDLGAAAGNAAGEDVLTLAGIGLATLDARDFLFA